MYDFAHFGLTLKLSLFSLLKSEIQIKATKKCTFFAHIYNETKIAKVVHSAAETERTDETCLTANELTVYVCVTSRILNS